MPMGQYYYIQRHLRGDGTTRRGANQWVDVTWLGSRESAESTLAAYERAHPSHSYRIVLLVSGHEFSGPFTVTDTRGE
jgi:hypothetical protein